MKLKKMLKIAFTLSLLIGLNTVKAQDAPTKEDAVNFMNKIASQFSWLVDENCINANTKISLKDCILTIVWEEHFHGLSYNYQKNTYIINLSNIHFSINDTRKIVANNKGDIYFECLHKNRESSDYDKKNSYDYWGPVDDVFTTQGLDLNKSTVALDNHYDERYVNALKFLIKECHGGKIVTNSDEKF